MDGTPQAKQIQRKKKTRKKIGGQKTGKTKCDCELKILIKKQNQFVDEC